jgi:hypothetical protein
MVGSEALTEEDEDCLCPWRMTGSRLVEEVLGVHSVGNRATKQEA